jgi:hypothetical protein
MKRGSCRTLASLYDAAGQADSALAAYPRFLARREIEPSGVDGWHRPCILSD